MGKRKALHMGRTQRKEGAAHVYFKFNSQTFERLRAKFQEMCSSSRDEIFRNNDLSIEVASKGSLSAVLCSMKFELCEIKKGLKEQVTMHLYAATTSLMVEGKSGKILSKPPFRCFADVFLEPLIAQETSDLLEEKSKVERPPVETQNCPICGKSVAEKEMNNHVDECLSVKAIATGSMLRNGKGHEMSSKVKVRRGLELKEEWSDNSNLVKFMERQIKELEEELECPVCMEVATTAPIYKCPEDHLICRLLIAHALNPCFANLSCCRICRPLLSECPQCRVALKGRSYVKFRGAERQAERLLALKEEKLAVSK